MRWCAVCSQHISRFCVVARHTHSHAHPWICTHMPSLHAWPQRADIWLVARYYFTWAACVWVYSSFAAARFWKWVVAVTCCWILKSVRSKKFATSQHRYCSCESCRHCCLLPGATRRKVPRERLNWYRRENIPDDGVLRPYTLVPLVRCYFRNVVTSLLVSRNDVRREIDVSGEHITLIIEKDSHFVAF